MDENIRQSHKKEVEALKKRVDELETTVKAVLKGMQDAEAELGEPLMPKGVYHGFDFND